MLIIKMEKIIASLGTTSHENVIVLVVTAYEETPQFATAIADVSVGETRTMLVADNPVAVIATDLLSLSQADVGIVILVDTSAAFFK